MRQGLTEEGISYPPARLNGMASRLWNTRSLIWALTKTDLKSRYVGSIGGVAWNVIQPLALIAVFTFLFSYLLQVHEFGSGRGYLFYLVAGLLPWNAFQEILMRSCNVFVENSRLVQKVPFPLESLVAHVIVSGLLNLAIGMAVLIFFLPLLGVSYGPWLLLLPAAILLEALLCAGPALTLASLTPFWRDVPPITTLLLLIGFWLTPIVYMPKMLPGEASKYFSLNPFHHLAMFFRASLSGEGFPSPEAFGLLVGTGLVMFFVGVKVFFRTHRKAPELL